MRLVLSILLLAVSQCLCQSNDEGWANPEEKECIRSLSLEESHIGEVVKAYAPGNLPEDDDAFSKFIHCRGQQMGVQHSNGELNIANLIQLVKYFPEGIFKENAPEGSVLGEAIAEETIKHCKNVPVGNSAGQTLIRLQNCIDSYLVSYYKK
ncbi:hypothetical protein PPYR_01165 [Photinus pyralis]|uniref:Uncharacterized protein n=1 Tax=Photinus pyralis TaxID=7054 RepID=A0A1Y1M660_PHOPY|nr:uncharacterized protein LOC116158940 [Photinus pyralis]KAB0804195.1 hypothetical protein PPYR_01165 [Photinus pyralis]